MPVALNTGRYLDGAVMGGSVQAIEGWYRRRGLERTESFHDLPDHVALQLEFVARLFAGAAAARQAGDDAEARQLEAEARAFLGAFVVHWLPGFARQALERTLAQHRLPAPYLYLAHILCAAVDATPQPACREAQSRRRSSMVTPIAASGPTPYEVAANRPPLAADDRSAEHLERSRSPDATRRSRVSRGRRHQSQTFSAPASASAQANAAARSRGEGRLPSEAKLLSKGGASRHRSRQFP